MSIRQIDTQTVWQRFSAQLLVFIRKNVANREAAEDLLQEIFTKIHKRQSTLTMQGEALAWLFQIARNAAVDYYRRRGVARFEVAKDLEDTEGIEGSLTASGLVGCLKPFIDQLGETDKSIIMANELQSVKLKQVAERLEMPYSTVKSRAQRARVKLRKLFLDCCNFDFDSRGGVIDYSPDNSGCDRR